MLIKRIFSQNSTRIKQLLLDSTSLKGKCLVSDQDSRHIFNKNSTELQIHLQRCFFSKQKILDQLQKLQKEIQIQNVIKDSKQQKKQNKNEFLEKQEKIVKDFLQLTEESFNQHLQRQIQQKYHIDPQMLLMIISSLEDTKIIQSNLVKLYPFITILQKSQLLLLFELIVTYRPKELPPFNTLASKPLQNIESILLLISQIYPKQQKMMEWIKQIPLYKGKNVYMIATGFFAIYQKMDHHVKFKNQKLIQKCMNRIIDLAVQEDQQTKISIAILAFQTPETCLLGEQFLIDIEKIDYFQVDPLKIQLLFLFMQRHLSKTYQDVVKQITSQSKYKVLQQTAQGELTQTIEQDFALKNQGTSAIAYNQTSQIEKFLYLNSILKRLAIKIMDMNWKQCIKLNVLLEYWRVFQLFEDKYPWNALRTKLISFTLDKQMIQKFQNLTTDEIIQIMEVMERLKINKSQLLFKGLALLSARLEVLDSQQLIRISKVCVTYVRQCEDYLISLRGQIQSRKFIFKDQQIDQLNQIYKRVLVLFPRPLTK